MSLHGVDCECGESLHSALLDSGVLTEEATNVPSTSPCFVPGCIVIMQEVVLLKHSNDTWSELRDPKSELRMHSPQHDTTSASMHCSPNTCSLHSFSVDGVEFWYSWVQATIFLIFRPVYPQVLVFSWRDWSSVCFSPSLGAATWLAVYITHYIYKFLLKWPGGVYYPESALRLICDPPF